MREGANPGVRSFFICRDAVASNGKWSHPDCRDALHASPEYDLSNFYLSLKTLDFSLETFSFPANPLSITSATTFPIIRYPALCPLRGALLLGDVVISYFYISNTRDACNASLRGLHQPLTIRRSPLPITHYPFTYRQKYLKSRQRTRFALDFDPAAHGAT